MRRVVLATSVALIVACSPATPSPVPATSTSAGQPAQGAGLESARPDSNVSAPDTAKWVARARADALAEGIQDPLDLVPVAVLAGEGQAFVWFRDYDTGEQLLAQYAHAETATPDLIGVYMPASKSYGASEWETRRITQAVADDRDLQSVVGQPVVILGVGVGTCESGPGACARVRLAGSKLAAPSDSPALAPIAFVDLRSLAVELVLPGQQTPEVKTLPASE
jgi:hypothetical protein